MGKIKTVHVITAAIVICIIAIIITVRVSGNVSLVGEPKQIIKVTSGMSVSEVIDILEKNKLISSPTMFKVQARLAGLEKELKIGEYEIEPGTANSRIINMFKDGRVRFAVLTIPEGYTVEQIAEKIAKEGLGDANEFKMLAKTYAPQEYMKTDDPEIIYKAEGFLYPSTYNINNGTSEQEI